MPKWQRLNLKENCPTPGRLIALRLERKRDRWVEERYEIGRIEKVGPKYLWRWEGGGMDLAKRNKERTIWWVYVDEFDGL